MLHQSMAQKSMRMPIFIVFVVSVALCITVWGQSLPDASGAGSVARQPADNAGAHLVSKSGEKNGCEISINFDDAAAPCSFSEATRLTNGYGVLGVYFSGPGGHNGGAILNECGLSGVTGYSSPNVLAFNSVSSLKDGGIPQGPETVSFTDPIVSFEAGFASELSGDVTVTAYNANNDVVDTVTTGLTTAFQRLRVYGRNITRVVFDSSAGSWAVDDLCIIQSETGRGVLVLREACTDAGTSSDFASPALTSLGYGGDFTVVDDSVRFEFAVKTGGWRLIMVEEYQNPLTETLMDALYDFYSDGGTILFSSSAMDSWNSHALFSAAGISAGSGYATPIPVYAWVPGPLFQTPNAVPNLSTFLDACTTDGYYLTTTTATAVAGYSESVQAGQAAITVNSEGRIIVNGFAPGLVNQDADTDGVNDMIELYENEIFSMNGLGDPALTASPSNVDFRIGPGDSDMMDITLTNTSDFPINWTGEASAAPQWFSMTPDTGTLQPGDSTMITLSVNAGGKSIGFYELISVHLEGLYGGHAQVPVSLGVIDPCPGNAEFSQRLGFDFDDGTSFTSSDGSDYTVYDSFQGLSESIVALQWWGLDLHFSGIAWTECDRADPNQFKITFYQDNAGLPGTVAADYTLTATSANTGATQFGYAIKRYNAELPAPLALSGGWISIRGIDPVSCWFLWASAPGEDNSGLQDSGSGPIPVNHDLSLCIMVCPQIFAPGTRVVSTTDYPDGNACIMTGSTGTIICDGASYGYDWLVRWEGIHCGHDGHPDTNGCGLVQAGTGWYMMENQMAANCSECPDSGSTFFTPGDRVVCLVDHPEGSACIMAGMMGTVICYISEYPQWLVEWDGISCGHNGNGECGPAAPGRGWFVSECMISLVPVGEGEGAVEGEGFVEGTVEGTPEGTAEGTVEGTPEGTPEGTAEGTPEGTVEGAPEGTVEGNSEGTVEGTPEGTVEGTPEGTVEGTPEGTVEGTPEGTVEGTVEGTPEGTAEGTVEGTPEGTVEGTTEGTMEGTVEGEDEFLTADQNHNNQISLSELLRVIQFFNSNGFHCEAGTEDGYAPGPGDQSCEAYDSDYNTFDWRISLSELLRVIQFFNSGGYHYCPFDGTEDGFCPGL